MAEKKQNSTSCDMCAYFVYDEEYETYVCDINLDEDEMMRFLRGSDYNCPYFKFYDEYKMVQKQN